MNVSRSGYYKWLKNKNILNQYELNRKQLGELILDVHKRKPSYGYHRIRKIILDENVEDSALIKFEGIYWTFKSVSGPLKKGTEVEIIGIEGNKILIKK